MPACTWATWPMPTRPLGQAARRCAHPGRRADAGAALRHAAPGPARRRRRQGRAARQRRDGRGSFPPMLDPKGGPGRATFLRNNLGKRSVAIDLKHPEAGSCSCRSLRASTSFAENFKAGTMQRLGLGYDAVSTAPVDLPVAVWVRQPRRRPTPDGPAYASIAEAMSGIYEYRREPGQPPRGGTLGALGDIIGALRRRSACSLRCCPRAHRSRQRSTSRCSTPWSP